MFGGLWDSFIRFKAAQGVSERTLSDYEVRVKKLFLSRFPTGDAQELRDSVLLFLSEPAAPATFNLKVAYLKVFFAWARDSGVDVGDPLRGIKKRRTEPRVVDVDLEDLKRVMRVPDRNTWTGLRDYCLMALQFDTGIRPKEVLSLYPLHFLLNKREVVVPAGASKVRKSRTLVLSDGLVSALRGFLQRRPPEWPEQTTVFCTQYGDVLVEHVWYYQLRRHGEKCGVKVRPYDLRHGFALNFLRNGGNPMVLQRIMGHSTMDMTKTYLAFTPEDLHREHEKASPLESLTEAPPRRRYRAR